MNIWVLVIIVGVIAMVVGPIFMLQPSARDRRLSQLRQTAAQKGMSVRLGSLALTSGKRTLAVYSLAMPKSTQLQVNFSLIQQGFIHDLHFNQQWDWANKKQIAPAKYQRVLFALLDQLDVDNLNKHILGLEFTPTSVGVYWDERGMEIEKIEELLCSYRDIFAQ